MENQSKIKIPRKAFKLPNLSKPMRERGVFVGDGLISNGHWLFSVAWLASLETRPAKRVAAFAQAQVLETVKARLLGDDSGSRPLVKLVENIDLREYAPANLESLESCKLYLGFRKGARKVSSLTRVPIGMQIQSKIANAFVGIDLNYFQAFKFDSQAQIFVRGSRDPIVIQSQGQIVGLVMPMVLQSNQTEGK